MALDEKTDRRIWQVNVLSSTGQLSPCRILTGKDCSPTSIRTGVPTRQDSNPTILGLRTKQTVWRVCAFYCTQVTQNRVLSFKMLNG